MAFKSRKRKRESSGRVSDIIMDAMYFILDGILWMLWLGGDDER